MPRSRVLGAAGLAGFCWFMFVVPDLAAVSCPQFRIRWRQPRGGGTSCAGADKGPLDRILLALSLMSGLNLLVRPILIITLYGGVYELRGLLRFALLDDGGAFSHAIVSLLLAFTLLAAAALDMMRDLRVETNTDPLSGLLNRRGFERAASDALSRHAPQGIPAALVIADLDHFKVVNDMFGHASATGSSSRLPNCCARPRTATALPGGSAARNSPCC